MTVQPIKYNGAHGAVSPSQEGCQGSVGVLPVPGAGLGDTSSAKNNIRQHQGGVSLVPGARLGDASSPKTIQEHQTSKTSLQRCKKSTLISTFNVRTLNTINQLPELVSSAIQLKADVICVQEHRFFHSDVKLKYHDIGKGWWFISASAWKNSINSTIGGVGMLLSPQAYKSLNKIEEIIPRIIIADFNGNPTTTIISCYSPTNSSDQEAIDNFYQSLSSVTRQVPKHNFLIIGGDLNAQIGYSSTHKFSYHKSSNRNGLLLEEFIEEHELLCLNTKFQKTPSKLWTITYANRSKAQLDYIIINKKWKNSAMNCQAYNSFEGVYSDHRIVTSKFRLSLRANKKTSSKFPPYNWSALATNAELKEQYSVAVYNKFSALQATIDEPSPNETYNNFVLSHEEAAKDNIPLKPKSKKHIPWESDSIKDKRMKLKEKSSTKRSKPSATADQELKDARNQLKDTYKEEQEIYIQNKINLIHNAAVNKQAALAWKTVNEVSGRKSSNSSKLKATSQADRLDKWKDHFKDLLGNTPDVSDTPIEQIIDNTLDVKLGHFTPDELNVVLKKIKNNKAAGLDNIPPEIWKTRAFDQILLQFCNDVYDRKPIDKWTQGCILPFPKKGDLGLASNYRGITLTSIAAKIYNSMLLNRIQPEVDKVLRKNQNGFRKNRSTVGQILTVRRLIEGVRAKNLKACLLFVDFSKAFDSIHRGKMEKILRAYGIPAETVAAIMMLYKNTKSLVRSPDGDTCFFDILAGVLQGDTLAPFLFVITLDYVLRTSLDKNSECGFTLTERLSSRNPANKLTDVDYADDLAITADTVLDAEKLLHLLEDAAKDVGLYVNASKTEHMNFNQEGTIKTKAGNSIKSIEYFIYLGGESNSTEKDFKIRIAKAWAALNKMNSVWKSNLSDKLKREFFRATVEKVLLYGATAWTLTKYLESKLDGTYTRMLRAILNISWREHPTKEQLYGPIPAISKILREGRMRFAGHCWRAKQELASDLLMWSPTHGTARVGRPKMNYIDQLSRDAGCQPGDLAILMEDRHGWRDRIKVRDNSTR